MDGKDENRTIIAIGNQEYSLGDGDGLCHRLLGNITWLSCRKPQAPTPDEKEALRLLKQRLGFDLALAEKTKNLQS